MPWISISRERSPQRFKEKVEGLLERLDTAEGQEQMCRTFCGTADRSTFGEEAPTEEVWAELIDSSRSALSWFARYFLDSDVYNAAKHGLGVYPGALLSRQLEVDSPCNTGGAASRRGDGADEVLPLTWLRC
jgi:hypothetical protein